MPRNGCRTRRSLSPVMIQVAFAEMANSRNLLSLGSRQIYMDSDISKKINISSKSFKTDNLLSNETYLSNFGRSSTSRNSLKVSRLAAIFPVSITLSNVILIPEFLNRTALIRRFVSTTKMLFFIQQLLQNFFGKSIFSSFITNFI